MAFTQSLIGQSLCLVQVLNTISFSCSRQVVILLQGLLGQTNSFSCLAFPIFPDVNYLVGLHLSQAQVEYSHFEMMPFSLSLIHKLALLFRLVLALELVVLLSFQAFSFLEVFTSSSFRHWPSTCRLRRFHRAFADEHLPQSLILHHHQVLCATLGKSAMMVRIALMAKMARMGRMAMMATTIPMS